MSDVVRWVAIGVLAGVALVAARDLPHHLMATESDLEEIASGTLVEPSDRRWIELSIPAELSNEKAAEWVRAVLYSPNVVWVRFDCHGPAEKIEAVAHRLAGKVWVAAGAEEPDRPPACEPEIR